MTQKRWVIPDIHGYSQTLQALLDQIRPNKTDHLIFLGDYIDRGPNSKGVIDIIMELQDKGYRITALIGNHEEFLLKSLHLAQNKKGFFAAFKPNKIKKEWMEFGGKDTLKSFGTKRMENIPQKYIDWMKKLEYYLEFKDYVIVHAGLNFRKEDVFSDKQTMLWAKEFKVIPSKIAYRQLIHGHTPVDLEYIHHCINTEKQDFIDLDNGVYMTKKAGFGNLLAFELNSRLLITQYNVEE
ncbi:MAG: serine/threonine protein phosphatase [Bacteroidales bacterium]|nr:serine/threonine protein phosphatase [Bacteroidales bacterium]